MRESNLAGGRSGLVREWIIFALCLGLGGHIALAVILHDPEAWPVRQAGLNGLLIGFFIYVGVQVTRSAWWLVRGRTRRLDETDPSEDYS